MSGPAASLVGRHPPRFITAIHIGHASLENTAIHLHVEMSSLKASIGKHPLAASRWETRGRAHAQVAASFAPLPRTQVSRYGVSNPAAERRRSEEKRHRSQQQE